MYFTQDDYKKIQQWLTKNSVKDTEFNEANIPFNGEETITIVQGNQNKKVFLKDLINQVFNLGISDFVNITDKYDAPNISLEEAIRLIPSRARKEGQVITFLDREDHWHIYQFKGVLNQWNVLDTWEDLFDWEKLIIDSILPDEEDLTKSLPDENGNSYLSLKDREYNPEEFSGLGRVILRKNIVEVEDPVYGKVKKNVLYQDMFTQSNTIYEIRYDFDLNGSEITIPEGCVLDFQGGSFDNGVIKGSKTCIKSPLKQIFGLSLQLKESYNLTEVYPEWWGAKGDGDNDDTEAIQSAIDFAITSATLITLLNSNYKITSTLIIGSHTHISGGQDCAPAVLSPVITQYGDCDIITINNDRFVSNHYIFDIHLSNIKLTHNIKKQYYGISLDEKAQNLQGSTLMNTTFKYLRITECKVGIAVLWNSKGGFLYNYWDNLYITDSNIGILFESYINEDTGNRYASYVNLNTFDNCHFSSLTNCGIFVRPGSTFTTNSICNGSFEGIGYKGVDLEIYKDYGCSAIAVLASSSGINTIENNYIEHIYPNTTNDNTNRVYTEDAYSNFLCACIVNLYSGLRIIGNHFYLFSKGINTGCFYTSVYTKDNNIRNLVSYHTNDYFLMIYNESFKTDPLYNQFVFEDIVVSPSDSTFAKYYVFEKNNLYNTLYCNIVDKTNFSDTPRLNYFVNNRELDKVKLYVNSDGNGDGLYQNTASNITRLIENVLYRNAKSIEFLIDGETSVVNSSYQYNSDIIKISPVGESATLNIDAFTSVFYSKTIIFENIIFNLNSYSAIKTGLNTNIVIFKNCKFNITSSSHVLLSINNGVLKNIQFEDCEFVNEDSHTFTLSTTNIWNCIINFDNTTIPEWMIVNDMFHITKVSSSINYDGMYIYRNDSMDRYMLKLHNGNVHYIELLSSGTFDNKPEYARTGERYFCTDIKTPEGNSNGIVIYKHSDSSWRDSLGREINDKYYYSTKGVFENRPTNASIGTAYFCTDRQTLEGGTDGIMIYQKGENVWVDALGRVVE